MPHPGTLHTYRGYVFTIEHDPPGYIVDFPDFPDIITSGSTMEQAYTHACEALDRYVAALGDTTPWEIVRVYPAPKREEGQLHPTREAAIAAAVRSGPGIYGLERGATSRTRDLITVAGDGDYRVD
jgi:predicted RNase H-like HicB family nuclease